MARLNMPAGPGGEAAMIWTLRPQLGGMVECMIRGASQQSVVAPEQRELVPSTSSQASGRNQWISPPSTSC